MKDSYNDISLSVLQDCFIYSEINNEDMIFTHFQFYRIASRPNSFLKPIRERKTFSFIGLLQVESVSQTNLLWLLSVLQDCFSSSYESFIENGYFTFSFIGLLLSISDDLTIIDPWTFSFIGLLRIYTRLSIGPCAKRLSVLQDCFSFDLKMIPFFILLILSFSFIGLLPIRLFSP